MFSKANKVSIWLAIILPLFSLIFMATIFGKGQIEDVAIGVVDMDNSATSREIVQMTEASPTFNILPEHKFANETQAREALEKMDIYGYLVIPQDFEKKIYNEDEPTLNYYYHYAVLAIGGEVNKAFTTVLSSYKAVFVAEKAIGSGLTKNQANSIIQPVTPQIYAIGNSNLNFTTYISYPFFFVFFQIIILTLIVYTIGKEVQLGKCQELHKVMSKIYPLIIIFLCEALIANYVFFNLLDIPCASPPTLVTISSLLFVLASAAFGFIIITAVPRMSIAISIASLIGALGATLCGVTFPIDQMYGVFEILSYLFPIRYFTEIQHNLIYNYIGLEHTWLYFCILLGFVLTALCMIPRLNKILKKACSEKKGTNFTHAVPVIYTLTLLMIGGTYGYGTLYNLLYDPNIVTEIPVAVVDKSNTELSRKYISYIDATQGINVKYSAISFTEAKELMKTHKAKGVLYIPNDFEERIFNVEGGTIMFYETTTAFLYYLTMQSSAVAAIQQLNNEYRSDVLSSVPISSVAAIASAPTVNIKGTALFNQNGGYGSFLLPIVMTLILFQIMILTIGNFLGSRTEKLLQSENQTDTGIIADTKIQTKPLSPIRSLLKDITPFVIGFWGISFCLLGLFPILFKLPTLGNFWLISTGSLIFLLATGLMAAACSFFFRDRERVMLYVSFFSVGLIFISGMSFPLHKIPWFWSNIFYYIFPSSPFIKFFIKTNSMGASLYSVIDEILILAMQCAVYFSIAIFVYRKRKLSVLQDITT